MQDVTSFTAAPTRTRNGWHRIGIVISLLIVAAAGVGGPAYSHVDTVVLGGGIFLGSASWWLLLSNLADWLGRKLGIHVLHVINMIAGALIVGFGTWQLVSLLYRWL